MVERLELAELNSHDRRGNFCHAIVAPDDRAQVVAGHLVNCNLAVISRECSSKRVRVAVRDKYATFPGLNRLVYVEAEDTDVTDGPRVPPIVPRAWSLRVVLDDAEVVLLSNLRERVVVCRLPEEVYRNDCLRMR